MQTTNVFTPWGHDRTKAEVAEKLRPISSSGELTADGSTDAWDRGHGEQIANQAAASASHLQDALARMQITTPPEQDSHVRIGSTVTVQIEWSDGDDEERTFTIGAFGELDTGQNLYSYQAPFSKAVMGLQADQTTTRPIQIGQRTAFEIEVIKIQPPSATGGYYDKIERAFPDHPPTRPTTAEA